MVRRGCKRSFGPTAQRSPKSHLHHVQQGFAPVQPQVAPVQEAFRSLGSKDLLHPLLTTFRDSPLFDPSPRRSGFGIPLTPDRGPNPHFLEKRVSGSKNPHFPSPLQRLEKGVFGPKIPIFYVFPCRKMGIFGPKTPFSRTRGNGVFGPRNLLFQEMGIRAPVWGRGNPNSGLQQYRCQIANDFKSNPLHRLETTMNRPLESI